jgi:hypothetical protein
MSDYYTPWMYYHTTVMVVMSKTIDPAYSVVLLRYDRKCCVFGVLFYIHFSTWKISTEERSFQIKKTLNPSWRMDVCIGLSTLE